MDIIQSDVAIIGAGGAGLRAAIEIARSAPNAKISLISKVYPMRSHTVAAEGGSAGVVREDDSLEFPAATGCASRTWCNISSNTPRKK